MTHKNCNKKNPLYQALLRRFGYSKFHIYNILPEAPAPSAIAKLRGDLQGMKWDGLVMTGKKKASIKIRGTVREVRLYQLT